MCIRDRAFDRSTPVTVADMFCANRSSLPVWLGHRKSERRRIEQMLEKVGARPQIDKKLGSLSGGELQRIPVSYTHLDVYKRQRLLFVFLVIWE